MQSRPRLWPMSGRRAMNCSGCSTTCSTSAATRRVSCASVQPTDLVELCEHVAAVHWSKARSRHLQLRLAARPGAARLDGTRSPPGATGAAQPALNAIKFSERGEVVLWARRQGRDFVRVDDEGPGISAGCCPGCSCPSNRESPAQSPGEPGLKAAICRQLMEQMGARSGSSLWLAGAAVSSARPSGMRRRRRPGNRASRRSPATAARELEYMRAWPAEFGGLRIRRHLALGPCRTMGLARLVLAGEPWIPAPWSACCSPDSSVAPRRSPDLPGAGRRVLLVEDHEVNRMLISMQLGQLGARVMSAANGRLALRSCNQESGGSGADGSADAGDGRRRLCRQLHADERWQHLPVYVITADLSEPAAQRLAECGC